MRSHLGFFLSLPACLILACHGREPAGSVSRVRGAAHRDLPAMTEAQRFGFAPEPTPVPSASRLEYVLPPGWALGPAQPLRELNVTIAGAPDVECYVMTLAGDGGGLEANVNRWCGQMGRPPLAAAEFENLERVLMLGGSGRLVEVSGVFQGLDGTRRTDQALIGVICPRPDLERTIFVKMIGPAGAVAARRAAFLEFCKSLRLNP